MYKKGTGNDKQGKDAGNRTLCPHRNFSQAIKYLITHRQILVPSQAYKSRRTGLLIISPETIYISEAFPGDFGGNAHRGTR